MVTSTRGQTTGFSESALRELAACGELEPGWRVAYETTEDSGDVKVYRVWFEKHDRSDSFGVRVAVGVKASTWETEEAAAEEIKRLVRARRP
jgi:hypothetical protein